MSETMFVVDKYSNRLKERTKATVLKEAAGAYGHQVEYRFDTIEQAVTFIIGRAEAEVTKAEEEVVRAKRKLAAVRMKYQRESQ